MQTKFLRRAAALGSVSLVALAQPASAATVTAPANLTYNNTNSQTACWIGGNFSQFYQRNDQFGADFTDVVITDANGNDLSGVKQPGVFPNGASAINIGVRELLMPANTQGTGPVYVSIFETDLNTRGALLAQTPLDLNQMSAAGGACATLATTFSTPAANFPPVANAGPNVVDRNYVSNAPIILDGSNSFDPDGDPLTYSWRQIQGPTGGVTLSNTSQAQATFQVSGISAPRQYRFELTVSDGTATDTSVMTINLSPAAANNPPVADAGADRTASANSSVTIDASGSTDSDGTIVGYSWRQVSGTSTSISNPSSAQATVSTPPASGSPQALVYEVTVTDDDGATSTDQVTITIPAAVVNIAPDAVTGADRIIDAGDRIVLDASGSSDPDGTVTGYAWTQVSGPSVTLSNPASVRASFIAPAAMASAQTLVFEVEVTDNAGATDTDTVTLTIAANAAPTAAAGADRRVEGGTSVTLDGSASSDPEGDTLTYSWVQTGGTSVNLSNANAAQATFTAPLGTPVDQDLTFELTVSDGISSVTDTVVITVEPNTAPVANAGADQGPIDSGQTVTLNGSGSSDPDGDTLTYRWVQTGGPSVTLSSSTATSPTFTAPNVTGTQPLTFQLIVNDGQVDSPADTVTITVQALGNITIRQRIVGPDTQVGYTTNVPGLASSVTTSNGMATASATGVSSGSYTFSVADLRAQGYALTALSCNDTDSAVNFAQGSIALELSPSEDLVCTVELSDTRGAAQEAIGEFLGGRNALLLAGQPDSMRRLDRVRGVTPGGGSASLGGVPIPGSGKLPVDMRLTGGDLRVSSSLAMASAALGLADNGAGRFDVWIEGQISDVTIGRNKGSFAVGFVGADYLLTDSLLVGAMFQYDRFDNDSDALFAGMAEGDGWMAGPYVTARLGERFFVDARVAYGQSDNSVSPLGTNVDGFETERLFFDFAATGEIPLGDGLMFSPEAGVRYLSEDVGSYTDSRGVVIPDFTVDQGEASLRPRIAYTTMSDSGWSLAPYAEFEGILTFGADRFSPVENGLRGKVAAGVNTASPEGVRIGIAGFYDGIGEARLEQFGGRIAVSFSF
ncbi:PKD domain-containing protein [Paraurantiacibacter namhicola]|uniref:Chitinase A n=1 Tax=Paraurantiacibacter namhicola TaxID=645517 RepID=A0A1C7D696_9SPHN|nr:PKD domain-containing protein [Paraurantiacibacter namhicola]ANU06978.1 Chitinase A precursor [Paraurantiacibacter namhicola]